LGSALQGLMVGAASLRASRWRLPGARALRWVCFSSRGGDLCRDRWVSREGGVGRQKVLLMWCFPGSHVSVGRRGRGQQVGAASLRVLSYACPGGLKGAWASCWGVAGSRGGDRWVSRQEGVGGQKVVLRRCFSGARLSVGWSRLSVGCKGTGQQGGAASLRALAYTCPGGLSGARGVSATHWVDRGVSRSGGGGRGR
jgi:hypothetical protein